MVKDHLGKEYTSISEMCANYSLKKEVFMNKKKQGIPLEEILTAKHSESSERNPALGLMADRIMTIRMTLLGEGGISQKEFGEYLGRITGYGEPLTLMMVSSVENSRRCFDMDVYIALADDLQISLDYIFGRTDTPTPYKPATTYAPYSKRVQAVLKEDEEMPNLKKRGTEGKLEAAELLNVPLDYLCGLTDEIKRH